MCSKDTSTLPVSVVVPTLNEAPNIARCLESVSPASAVYVVDSGSVDDTVSIARSAGAEVVHFRHEGGYPKKRQWLLDQDVIATPWVMLLDADEVVPPELWSEIRTILESDTARAAYLARKEFHFLGKRFRFGGFSHSAVLLFRRGHARFERLDDVEESTLDMEVHERMIVTGKVGRLKTPLIHDDKKGITAYIDKHNHYATWEARVRYGHLKRRRWGAEAVQPRLFGNVQERRRLLKSIACRVPGEPAAWFLYHYVLRLGFLEGRRGYFASALRAQYISNVRAKLYEMRLGLNRATVAHDSANKPAHRDDGLDDVPNGL